MTKHKCVNCGSKHNLSLVDDTLYFCAACQAEKESFYGFPVLDKAPERCSCCGGSMETGLLPCNGECDELDEDRAILCGIDVNDYKSDEEMPYRYIYEAASCEDTTCKLYHYELYYGRRHYWNEADINYTADAPMTPQEKIRAENAYQEAMGQMIIDFEGVSDGTD